MSVKVENYRFVNSGSFGQKAFNVGVAGLVLGVVGAFVDSKQFFHSYLLAFVFWTTIALGGLFFTMLHHVTGARWSVVLRRISETLMANLPMMLIFFVPLLFGLHDLYHWTHKDAIASDELLRHKTPYLNTGFFIVRGLIFFGIWTFVAKLLYGLSLKQDTQPSDALLQRMRRISAPGLIVFALSITYASFDWLMSLDPHWFSTIFGVYIFAGSMLAVLSFITLTALGLRRFGILSDAITVEHYHDLGKLMFGFIVFWSYIAFSQYFLIWYSNIPEETVWFTHRWVGSWKYVSLLIVFGHFVLPFSVLLGRAAKRNFKVMAAMACWLLFIHVVDMYWLIFPTLHHHGVHLSWIDAVVVIGIGGIFVSTFWKRFVQNPIVPVQDPYLEQSRNFHNV